MTSDTKNPWEGEPDFLRFRAHGLHCLIMCNRAGSLCGYVRVPRGNLYDRMLKKLRTPDFPTPMSFMSRESWKASSFSKVRRKRPYNLPEVQGLTCHGGITFAGRIRPQRGLWVGFDCAHAGDSCPTTEALLASLGRSYAVFSGDTYRTFDYVRLEVEALAEQIKEIQND